MSKIIGFAGGAFINVQQGVRFVGPAIPKLTLTVDVEMSPRNFALRFSGAEEAAFSIIGELPEGLELSEEGVLSGTPTVVGTTIGLRIEADDGERTAQSNAFAIVVREPHSAGVRGVGGPDVGRVDITNLQSVGSAEVGG